MLGWGVLDFLLGTLPSVPVTRDAGGNGDPYFKLGLVLLCTRSDDYRVWDCILSTNVGGAACSISMQGKMGSALLNMRDQVEIQRGGVDCILPT